MKKLSVFSFLILIFIFGCSNSSIKSKPKPDKLVKVIVKGDGIVSFQEKLVKYGETITIVAEGQNGSDFISWNNDISANNNQLEITVKKDMTIRALFLTPILISTLEELEKIGNVEGFPLDGYYKLTNNIDASITKESSYNNGKGWDAIGDCESISTNYHSFGGRFDGGGYTISNLYINDAFKTELFDFDKRVGLFEILSYSALIKNLNLENVDITGYRYVGAIAGTNKGTIVNCSVTGTVKGFEFVGGLVGENITLVERSFSDINVFAEYTLGGLVGLNTGLINESFSTSKLSGKINIGGLVGKNDANISTSYTSTFWVVLLK